MSCFVKECKNIRRLCTDPEVTFHRLPKNERRRKQWLSAIGKEHVNLTNEAVRFVCSQHFKTDDFYAHPTLRHLKPTAVPNLSRSVPTVIKASSNGRGALEINRNNFKTMLHGKQELSPEITSFDNERSGFKLDHIYSKKDPSVWTREITSLLITLYEQNPCLYNCKSPDYHKRDVKRSACTAIAEEINTSHQTKLTAEDIKKKIHVIRSQYVAEINAIKKSAVSGAKETYYPRMWCFDQLNFIDAVNSMCACTQKVDIKIEMDDNEHDSRDDLEQLLNGDDFEIPGISLEESDKIDRLQISSVISLASDTSYNPGKRKRNEVTGNILHSDPSNESLSIHFPFAQYLISELELIDNEEVLDDLKHDIVKLVFQAKKRCRNLLS